MSSQMRIDATDFIAFLKQFEQRHEKPGALGDSVFQIDRDSDFAIDLGGEPNLQTTSSSILKKDWDFWGAGDSDD